MYCIKNLLLLNYYYITKKTAMQSQGTITKKEINSTFSYATKDQSITLCTDEKSNRSFSISELKLKKKKKLLTESGQWIDLG